MLSNLLIPLCLMGVTCLLTLILTPLVKRLMTRLGAVDQPDARRVNQVPIPRGGGLAVVLSFLICVGIAYWCFPEILSKGPFYAVLPWFLGASFVLVAAGLVDDVRGISPIAKLLAQIIAALLLCYGGARFLLPLSWGAWTASPWVYVPLTVAWYIGVINAFNLIDGLDGLSSGLALIATIGLTGIFLVTDVSIIPMMSCIFMGALLGFLRYNYHPATIFLGDTGSLFLGLFLGTLALITRREDAFILTMGLSVLCIGMPLIDTSLAVVRRTLRYVLRRVEGNSTEGGIMVADRSHIHHRLLAYAKGNQRLAVWGLYGLAIALVALGFLSASIRLTQATIFLIGLMAFTIVIVRAMTDVELWDTGRLVTRPGARNGSLKITVPLYLLADVVIMVVSFIVLHAIASKWLPTLSPQAWFHLFLWYAVPVLIGIVAVKGYTRIWGRSTRKDAFMIVAGILVASLISHLLVSIVFAKVASDLLLFHMVWVALLPLPILFVRLGKTIFIQGLLASENKRLLKQSLSDTSIKRVLFYGAGMNLRAYVTLCEVNVTRNAEAMVGILDDNLGLRGRVFRNLPILGPLEMLEDEALFQKLRPTKILVTTPTIGEARLAEIKAFCRAHGLTLARCSLDETPISLESND